MNLAAGNSGTDTEFLKVQNSVSVPEFPAAIISPMRWLIALLTLAACERNGKSVDTPGPEPGIALTLAAERVQAIENLRYELSFSIPGATSEPVSGRAVVRFALKDTSRPVVLDFTPGADSPVSLSVGGRPSRFRAVKDHIIIPKEDLSSGENTVEIVFRAGDAPLNRNPDFMYTLFVPARAYLFAFAAGKFQLETAGRNGRIYRMFHRETDAKKVARNRDVVFDLHASSLEWLEKYTVIPYPFGKFDFVAIPSFQFGGMEHPGAIFYNASSILLDESATENQMLNRASTIAHETSHMWFGDLVTMRWFNDVWMKEVFANFMAAKIVNPSFPKVNHELRFLLSNYPSAYSVDRTGGTHPIRQELENLNAAGQMYGAIIYQKAPIVMRQLEL